MAGVYTRLGSLWWASVRCGGAQVALPALAGCAVVVGEALALKLQLGEIGWFGRG